MSKSRPTLAEKYRRLQLLHRIGSIASSSLEPPELLRKLLDTAVQATHASSGSIMLIDPNSGMLEIETAVNLPARI
ncbi:hypothetical protein QQ056_10445, partial [Oscillatoria laete-virens NRMC-F 0139]|nr:hypothetical protein [Oscillatoria laete-virens NRMC-F 0139]